jgi:segregation and condensation protein B
MSDEHVMPEIPSPETNKPVQDEEVSRALLTENLPAATPLDESEIELQPVTGEEAAELQNIVEALIFASDEPISTKFIRQIIDEVNKDRVEENRIRATTEGIKRAVAAINKAYADRAFHITPIAGGFVFATKSKYSVFVGKLAKEKARRKLSATAIESLAIIAYKQPITKSEIEFIRGVNADYIIKTLLEKNLITITGRATTPGRPLLYGTTDEFLKHFGLNEITDLPKPREIEELIGETELEVEKRMLAEQQELEFKDELSQKLEGGAKPTGTRAPLRQNATRVVTPDAQAAPPPVASTPEPAAEVGPTVEQPVEPVVTTEPMIEDEVILEPVIAEPSIEEEDVEEVSADADVLEEPEVEEATAEVVVLEEPEAEEETAEVVVLEEPEAEEATAEEVVLEEPEAEEASADAEVTEETDDDDVEIDEPITDEPVIDAVPADEPEIEQSMADEVVVDDSLEIQIEEEKEHDAQGESPALGGTEFTPEKGWSKWKTKIKTFFKKLFV